jgi:hypothetical protein
MLRILCQLVHVYYVDHAAKPVEFAQSNSPLQAGFESEQEVKSHGEKDEILSRGLERLQHVADSIHVKGQRAEVPDKTCREAHNPECDNDHRSPKRPMWTGGALEDRTRLLADSIKLRCDLLQT